jgi:hypothetical protein
MRDVINLDATLALCVWNSSATKSHACSFEGRQLIEVLDVEPNWDH